MTSWTKQRWQHETSNCTCFVCIDPASRAPSFQKCNHMQGKLMKLEQEAERGAKALRSTHPSRSLRPKVASELPMDLPGRLLISLFYQVLLLCRTYLRKIRKLQVNWLNAACFCLRILTSYWIVMKASWHPSPLFSTSPRYCHALSLATAEWALRICSLHDLVSMFCCTSAVSLFHFVFLLTNEVCRSQSYCCLRDQMQRWCFEVQRLAPASSQST